MTDPLGHPPAPLVDHQPRLAQQAESDSSSSSYTLDPDSHVPTAEFVNADLHQLARTYSRRSSVAPADLSNNDPLDPVPDSILDPCSSNFKPEVWSKAVWDLQYSGPDAPPTRKAGFAFEDLSVHGFAKGTDYQTTVGSAALKVLGWFKGLVSKAGDEKVQILQGVDGYLEPGEMLVVLGPPGSGCSTFLKTLANETHGFYVADETKMNFRGITREQMVENFSGEAIYSAETEQHFPLLTVRQTLEFAAAARAPRNPPGGLSQLAWAQQLAAVTMAIFGISDTRDVRVGDNFHRGVSGGQRKRVSIAEVTLANAPLNLFDNSTRGLDSATAIAFCRSVKSSVSLNNSAACVAIYQAPQPAYDVFDKVLVLYEGRSIYFGNAHKARAFFIDMGFHCPTQQTTPDFLTGLTSTLERRPREGFEKKVPHTPEEFEAGWKSSPEYKHLKQELAQYDQKYPTNGAQLEEWKASRLAQKSKNIRPGSPFTLSYAGQVKLCLRRGFQRLKADPSLTYIQLFGNCAIALILSSVFYNMKADTSSFFSRGGTIFFAILLSAFASALEVLTLYAQRPIVDKQVRYAFYHASAESFASILTDLPYKIINSIVVNLIIYFMTNLRREAGSFFFFTLVSFTVNLAMSHFFRALASMTRTLAQAMIPSGILILALVLYTGFALPVKSMLGWISWLRWINPIQYGFESLMANEFHNRNFPCAQTVPSGPTYPGADTINTVCSISGSIAGQDFVNGDRYINYTYRYYNENKWRNYGIVIVFTFALLVLYIAASEMVSGSKSKGELKLYPRTRVPKALKGERAASDDIEAGAGSSARKGKDVKSPKDVSILKQTAIFHFEDLCYDIPVKGGTRRLLDHVDGWVKPGTLTALMGVSGAGKTTLLDVLASRVTMGVITGDIFVDGNPRDDSFQRKTGYVQQQDPHLETATVREALQFSAILRQPHHVPREEKIAYAEEILVLLGMDKYADAVVGVAGEGLNVEERKRLSIGVEMVAKPELLLFLDEPSSGLDSQTSWAILDLLDTLKNHGQAILCTIHQPSAMLFSRFDRLLFLARGGKTIYYGDVGEESKYLIDYFQRNGSQKFPEGVNPAEFMLEVIGAASGSHSDINWHETWLASAERQGVKEELHRLRSNPKPVVNTDDKWAFKEFAAPTSVQFYEVQKRVFQQYWRSPGYIYSKTALCVLVALFIGFSFFRAPASIQGLQNLLFSVFMLFIVFGQLVEQMLPEFIKQRESYEVRERPSRTYGWQVFMLSNIIVELVWNSVMGLLIFLCMYFPIGYSRFAEESNSVHERGALFFLLTLCFMLFTSTFAHFVIAFNETAENGGNVANLIFVFWLLFCGVLATPDVFPRFWIWIYRLSPFTYLVEGLMSAAFGNATVECANDEWLRFAPTDGQTCAAYLETFMATAGGYLRDVSATETCEFCPIKDTNVFLARFKMDYNNRWRNFGILCAYICFNAFGAVFLYWLARVPKKSKSKKDAAPAPNSSSEDKHANNRPQEK